jgi:hypothetical protein
MRHGRDSGDGATHETGSAAGDQASLHAGRGREDPPARDTERQTPFVVRVGVEEARSYPAGSRAEAVANLDRAAADLRDTILAALDPILRPVLNLLERSLSALGMHTRRRG